MCFPVCFLVYHSTSHWNSFKKGTTPKVGLVHLEKFPSFLQGRYFCVSLFAFLYINPHPLGSKCFSFRDFLLERSLSRREAKEFWQLPPLKVYLFLDQTNTARNDVSKFRDGRVHVRNTGVKGLLFCNVGVRRKLDDVYPSGNLNTELVKP